MQPILQKMKELDLLEEEEAEAARAGGRKAPGSGNGGAVRGRRGNT